MEATFVALIGAWCMWTGSIAPWGLTPCPASFSFLSRIGALFSHCCMKSLVQILARKISQSLTTIIIHIYMPSICHYILYRYIWIWWAYKMYKSYVLFQNGIPWDGALWAAVCFSACPKVGKYLRDPPTGSQAQTCCLALGGCDAVLECWTMVLACFLI